jgi:hypothetical protein
MNFNGIIIAIGIVLFLVLTAFIIRIFNKSRTTLDWFSYLLKRIGKLLAFILFLDIQLLIMLVVILIVWGASYKSLLWGETDIPSFWNSVLIVINFIYFFMLLWWSGTKGFYNLFAFRKSEPGLNLPANIERGRSIIPNKAQLIKGSGMSFLIPLMIIIGLVLLGATCFGAFTSFLVSNDSISFSPNNKNQGLSELTDYYLWHFLQLIPQIKVTETIRWDVPFTYSDKGVGWILLLFKALMAYIVITRFYTWNKWRKERYKGA